MHLDLLSIPQSGGKNVKTFVYQVPVYFLFGGMYIRARFTAVFAHVCNYSGMYVELVYMYDHHNWARLPILLAVS